MTSDINNLIAQAEDLARKHDDQGAMSLANELVGRYPHELKVWSLRAYLQGRKRDYASAIADATRAIEIGTSSPEFLDSETGPLTILGLLFNRGADRFAIGDYEMAVDDFTRGLEQSDRYKDHHYRETLHFWRAEALLRLRRKQEALADLSKVHEDFSFWTDKLRTKADLLADCGRLPG